MKRLKGICQEKEALAREHRLAHQYSYTVDLQPHGSMVADIFSDLRVQLTHSQERGESGLPFLHDPGLMTSVLRRYQFSANMATVIN